MDEVFYYDGSWYMAKEAEIPLPPFDFAPRAEYRNEPMIRDMLWSMRIAPPPITSLIVTGV